MAINYDSIFNALAVGLAEFIVDSQGDPILTTDRIVAPEYDVLPKYPFMILAIPLAVDEDRIGFNVPNIHEIVPLPQDEPMVAGEVDEVQLDGEYAGRLLIDSAKDFNDLDMGEDESLPNQVRPGDWVYNLTTGKNTKVFKVLEGPIVLLGESLFMAVGDEYAIHRSSSELIRVTGRYVICNAAVEDAYPAKPKIGYDPVKNVNNIIEQANDYFKLKANYALSPPPLCLRMDQNNGVGSVLHMDYTLTDRGGSAPKKIFRRDMRFVIRSSQEIKETRDDLITRAEIDLNEIGLDESETVDTGNA
jgi:hypothetical protein